ncbi:hypothetical protein Q1695_003004 [Nippostrongylus brasiliensis]|nr:hypothetical protein Q1695_003004 [Nippostrongylus brasiliensis]
MTLLAGVLLATVVAAVAAQSNISFSGAQGMIYSPNYPDNYPNQLNQKYTITVDAGYYIYLTFYDFETEACCDILYIWDSDTQTGTPFANVSGTATGMTLSSKGRYMTLLFSTDITGSARGFAIHYEMVLANTQYVEPNACESGLLTASSGFVTSPQWPANYPNEISCSYLISMPKGRVMLTFVAFATEACCDKVEIYDGPNTNSNKLAELSGAGLANTTFYSTQQSMYLVFYSDYTQNDKGFSAFYMQVT